jgi:hypothetical protein
MKFMKPIHLLTSFLVYHLILVVGFGQLPSARFDQLYPPSAQRGSEAEVTVSGQDLEGVQWLKFSHAGIKAEPKKDEDGEIVPNVFNLKVAGNAPLGIHKGWIGGGKFGASNYRSFVVGDLPEVEAGAGGASMEKPFEIELGQTVLGKAPANKFAWFKFSAKKGQRVLVEVSIKDIDSKLTPSIALYDSAGNQLQSDPQNGLLDFTAGADGDWLVRLNDFLYKGGDDYVYRLTASTRPRIDLIYPPVGKAGTNQKFTLFGRNLPGGQPSDWKTKDGKTLEKKEVQIQLPTGDARTKLNLTGHLAPFRAAVDYLEYRVESPQGVSGVAYVGYGAEEVTYEADADNDLAENAQKVSAPCEFVGKFFPAADKDRLRFSAKKGEVYRIEVFSERLGRPSHAFFLLEQLTKKDDGTETAKEIGQSLETPSTLGGQVFDVSTRDPSLRFEAPAEGDYRILLYDLFNSSPDPLNVYRLSIRREEPDFRLAAYVLLPPSANTKSGPLYVKSPTIRKGETLPVKVMALRRDGFKDAIDLEVTGLPAFVTYSPKRLPEGADSVTMLFQPNDKAGDWDGLFSITGKAKVGGKEARRECRFGDVAWSSYYSQAKMAQSHIHVVPSAPFAVLGRETAPVKVLFDDSKLHESAQKALETVEKSFTDAQAKLTQAREKLKAPVEAEKKTKAEAVAKKKELLDKEKERDDLVNVRLKAAKEKATQADAAYAKAGTDRNKADAVLKTVTAEVAKAKTTWDANEKAAKAAEALAAAAQNDPNKPDPEKQKAKQDAEAKRKGVTDGKGAHDNLVNSKLNPAKQQLEAAGKALTNAKSKKDKATKEVASLEAESKKIAQVLAGLPNQVRQAEQKATTAKTAADKAQTEVNLAEAVEVGKKKELEASKVRLAEATKRKDNPPTATRVIETAVGGIVKLPIKLDSTDGFKAATKVKIYGHSSFSKIKEINVDPKKKNEGTLEVNLATAKLPAGEFSLFCSAQVKGKYKIYSEDEAKTATEAAKKVDEQLKASQTAVAEAKKALAETKKQLDQAAAAKKAAEAELTKVQADRGKAEAAWGSADKKAKEAEEKTRATVADTSKPQPEKEAAQKDSDEKRKRANDSKLALEKLTAELLKPAEQKLVNSGKALASSEKVHKEAELRQKDADAKAKRLDAKKKVADAIAKKMTDASKKPKDVTVTLFTNPFTLKVRETPLELQPLGKQTIQVGEKVKLDLSIVRLFGFADAVSFKIVPPKEAKGVSAKVATIAKDAYATTLELVTSAATTAGEFECKLEGTLKFNNQNLKFTETFVLKVEPAPEVKKPG